MMREIGLAAGAVVLVLAGGAAYAQRGVSHVSASVEPRQEVPAVASPARGTFEAQIDEREQTVEYTFTYSGLQAGVRMAHIHFAQPDANGGIMVWLCGTANFAGPAGTQVCPQAGTVTGVIRPAHVQSVSTQGIAAGAFDDFLSALRGGLAYVNIHTDQSPGGEMRGQLLPGSGHH